MGLYTKLLLHGDGTDGSTTILDSEAGTKKTVTVFGNAQIDTAQKQFGTGSILFDGTGDYLSLADSDDWNFGTGNFTIDFWIRFNTLTSFAGICGQGSTGNFVDVLINGADGRTQLYSTVSSTEICSGYGFWTTDTTSWHHIAIVRYGTGENNLYIFVDGVSTAITWAVTLAANQSFPDLTDTYDIGKKSTSAVTALDGWIDEFRISKGIARWTSNFTPPTSAYASEELSFDDSVSSSDIFSRIREIVKDFPDNITLVDLITFLKTLTKSPIDNISLNDLIEKIKSVSKNFPDIITLNDLITKQVGVSKFLSETFSLSEKNFETTYTDRDVIEISTDPQIQHGLKQGQVLSLQYVNNYPKLRFTNGRGLSLFKGKDFTMGSGSIINFIYDTANSVWQETSRMQEIGHIDGEG